MQYGENKFFVDNRFFMIFSFFYRLSTAMHGKKNLFADKELFWCIAVDNSIENLLKHVIFKEKNIFYPPSK